MLIYFIVVFSVVAVTSGVLLLVFNKIKLLNFRVLLAITSSSVLSGLLFPGLFNLVSSTKPGVVDIPVLLFVLLTTVVLYIILAFILGIIISFVIPEGVLKAGNTGSTVLDRKQADTVEPEKAEANTGDNYLAEIYNNHIDEKGKKDENTEDITLKAENNLEKSVDSEENIDKMGLETLEPPEEDGLKAAENLSIDDCLDEAFRLKELGDLEGAILYYMYALDRNPAKDLVFWIVLDICVLYKNLGQIDFAREILSSYTETYSDLMDNSVWAEIERNLSYIQD